LVQKVRQQADFLSRLQDLFPPETDQMIRSVLSALAS